MVVLSLLGLVFLIAQRPLLITLRYPLTLTQLRGDRVAGQTLYNKIYKVFRNATAEESWTSVRPNGETYLLVSSLAGLSSADSEGTRQYTFWSYSSNESLLRGRSWSVSELSDASLPAPSQEPTDDEWDLFAAQTLRPQAHHVTEFVVEDLTLPESGIEVRYSIKNPKREGKIDQYFLEMRRP